ncbi:hypothetical protein EOD73_09895 [Inhella crocodyli]|uniref:Lipoprotein n=2 Tax=Inhella crocodyli TaxID=2499851 RepID=A0A437LLN0_9BURK|nr:hypothetical protein EOD73_09895 [Inhella crocodyli]
MAWQRGVVWALALMALGALSGCGQKGPLRLPPPSAFSEAPSP